jgi:twinkle protein
LASLKDFGIENLRRGPFNPGQHKAVCPSCSNRPNAKTDPSLSVHVNADGFSFWNCHYCKWTGNTGGKQLKTVVSSGTPIPYSPENELAKLIGGRSISPETLRAFNVTLASKLIPNKGIHPCIVFPYTNPKGNTVHAIKYRTATKDFVSETGGENILFGMHLCDPEHGTELIITEGEFDTLAGYESELRNIVSVPNSATANMDWIQNCQEFLAGFTTFTLAVDNDNVGKELRDAIAARLGPERCKKIEWPEGVKDFNEALQRSGAAFVRDLATNARPFPVNGIFDASDFFSQLDDFIANGDQRGLSTGIKSLDEWFTIRPAEYTIVTGYPGSGKSEFVDQIMVNMAELHKWKWGVASFENDSYEHIAKLIEKHMLGSLYKNPKMSPANYAKGKIWVQEHFKFILKDIEEGSPSMEWVIEKMTIANRQFGLNGFVVDPWNMLSAERGMMSETDHAADCLRKLRGFVKKTRAHVFLVCHPKVTMRNKDGNFPVPTLHDIAGGKNFFAMTDNGISIARLQDEDAVDVYVRKIRSRATGKAGGVLKLNWDPRYGRYYEEYLTEGLSGEKTGVL